MDDGSRKRGDAPLLAAAVVTVLLAAAVIWGVRHETAPKASFEKFDVERVIELIDRGTLSGREADYWEKVR